MKTCTKCGEPGPFYRDRRAKDGQSSWCRRCINASNNSRYANNPEPQKASSHKRYELKREECLARMKDWYHSHPDEVHARNARARLNHPDRIIARRAVSNAIRDKRLPHPSSLLCVCGQVAEQYHHHRGYAIQNQLDVIPLCKSCHIKRHKTVTVSEAAR